MNKLNIVQTEAVKKDETYTFRPKSFREQTQARLEREWHQNPQQFDPDRNIKEKERIKRTISFLNKHLSTEGMKVADLGCGMGVLSKAIRDQGASVDAVDVAKQPLNLLNDQDRISTVQSCVPNTLLADSHYDLVVCTELIGELPTREHRLFFNELARLVKREGKILFSTEVDIYSDDALHTLIGILQTELEIIDYQPSYHSRYIRLKNLFAMPKKFARASRSPELRSEEIKERQSITALWFKWNSTRLLGKVWEWCTPFFSWIEHQIGKSAFLLKILEKISHSEQSISHLIILAKRRPLMSDASNK